MTIHFTHANPRSGLKEMPIGKGYMGKILWVDLSRGVIREEAIPDETYEYHLPGVGLAAHLLYQIIPAEDNASLRMKPNFF